MKDFVAIDFETANRHRTSICSVGVVIVRDGKVVDKLYHLVKPYPNYYSDWATDCHGLSAQDTANAHLFPKVWAEIVPQIEGLTLVAHNKGFDESHLIKCYEYYGMSYPNYTFRCTLSAARRSFPELPNHQLHTVSAHVGFDLDNHHHALADAEACAAIAIEIL
jgi:DNA polymerase-3 subunit epsilon